MYICMYVCMYIYTQLFFSFFFFGTEVVVNRAMPAKIQRTAECSRATHWIKISVAGVLSSSPSLTL